MVSPGKREGKPMRSWRTAPSKAWRYPSVQYGHAGSAVAAIVLDCDDSAARANAIECGQVPLPNWQTFRIANGHAHVVYALAAPVHRHSKAALEPLRELSRIEDYYLQTTGADTGYNGLLAHNPVPLLYYPELETVWGREEPYSLEELAEVIPVDFAPVEPMAGAVGRNCHLFDSLMQWAGRESNARYDVLHKAMAINRAFAHPLPENEVRDTAKSVSKYRDR